MAAARLPAAVLLYAGLALQPLAAAPDEGRTITIGTFQPFSGEKDVALESAIRSSLLRTLERQAYQVSDAPGPITVGLSRSQQAHYFVAGFYGRSRHGNVRLHGQIYDPRTRRIVDALRVTDPSDQLSGDDLPLAELRTPDTTLVEQFARTLVNRIAANPNRRTNTLNVGELARGQLGGRLSRFLRGEAERKRAAADQAFQLMEETLVTTASRRSTTVREAPAAVYVITEKQIRERGYRTLQEALHDVPGFDFQHTYGTYPELVHQRGLIGENHRTLVYIDGILDNNINNNEANGGTLRFPLANVRQIEIVSGPASALYGANAFNGVVNVVTHDGRLPETWASLTYGTWEGLRNPGAGTNFVVRGSRGGTVDSDPLLYSLGLYYFKSQGPWMGGTQRLDRAGVSPYDAAYAVESELCGGVCQPDATSVGSWWSDTYNNSREESYNVTARFQWGAFRFETVNWRHLQSEGTFANGTHQIDTEQRGLETNRYDARNNWRRLGIALGLVNDQGFPGSDWDYQNNNLLIGHTTPLSSSLILTSEFVHRNTQLLSSSGESYPNTTDPGAYYRPGDHTSARNYARPDYSNHIEERLDYAPGGRNRTVLGLVAGNFVAARDFGDAERITWTAVGVYAEQTLSPWEPLLLTLGYRQDLNTIYGTTGSPRLGANLTPLRDLTIKLLYSTGFREPFVKELYGFTAQRKQNPDLQPERLRSYEVGIAYRFSPEYYASLHAYRNRITNLIVESTTNDSAPIDGVQPSGGLWQQNQNLGEATIHGVEAELAAQVLRNLRLELNYTYTRGRYERLAVDQAASPSTAGRPGDDLDHDIYAAVYEQLTGRRPIPSEGEIPFIAPHKAYLGVTWYPAADFSVYVAVNYVDVRRTRPTSPVRTVDGYRMFKINLRRENLWWDGLFVQLQINNATNEQFFDPGIRPGNGRYYPAKHPLERRNIWLTVGYRF